MWSLFNNNFGRDVPSNVQKIVIDVVCIVLSVLKILIDEMQSSEFPF